MSRRTKLLAKLANFSSDNNWSLDDLILVLTWAGFAQTGGQGSHRFFTHPRYTSVLCIAAHGNAVKSGYVKSVREALQNLEEKK